MATKKPPDDKPPRPDRPDRDRDRGAGTETLARPEQKTQRPKLYRVVMHNDDFTTQEFVIHVLMAFFRKDATEATQVMLKVHMKGRAIVGLYTKDVAETKAQQVTDYARENGHPLMLTVEPED